MADRVAPHVLDAHAHLMPPDSLYAFWANLNASGGGHGRLRYLRGDEDRTREELAKALEGWNLPALASSGIDFALLSPRPFHLMHSSAAPALVRWWIETLNDLLAMTIELQPNRFRALCALPQCPEEPVETWLDELDRCAENPSFVGVLLNPDPGEGRVGIPPMGDAYWDPVWERLVRLDLAALVHPAGCFGRESYSEHFATEESLAITSIVRARVFERFPELRLVIAHGGGSIPFQIGRWRQELGAARGSNFDDELRRFWFDASLDSVDSLELLFKTVGTDRTVFGAEGVAASDVAVAIAGVSGVSDEARAAVFSGNARDVYRGLNTLTFEEVTA